MRNWIHYNELNEAMNCSASVKNNVKPGMGATMFCGSDRYAMVVTEVLTPKKIKVAHVLDAHEDKFVDENGIDFLPNELLEEYKKFVPDEYGYCSFYVPRTYTLRKNGRWMPQGNGMWETSSIHIGVAENYRDPSF